MRKIHYIQIWALDIWLLNPNAENLMDRFFTTTPEVQWLLEEGYKPTIAKHYNYATQNVEVEMSFSVPEEVTTYLLLRYTDNETEIEIYG